jgi:protein-disulfide isomerase
VAYTNFGRLPVAALAMCIFGWLAVSGAPASAQEQALGASDAEVTIIEFASMSCPHCARFHSEVMPWLKKTYIDPGHVRLVFSDFPLNAAAIYGAAVAHCAASERYFEIVDLLFAKQDQWAFGEDPKSDLVEVAVEAGMDADAVKGCMSDEALQTRIVASRKQALENHKIKRTPTLVVGDQLHGGVPSREVLTKLIEQAGH